MFKIRYASIRKLDITNGPGVRVSLFTQGCNIFCKGCFNSDIWNYDGGKEWTEETKKLVLDLCNKPQIKGLSILGGEPLSPQNFDDLKELLISFKELMPNKSIWLWTGYVVEDLTEEQLEVVKLVDVLVDGPWMIDLGDFNLKYRGSSNQRIINVKETLNQNSIILLEDL